MCRIKKEEVREETKICVEKTERTLEKGLRHRGRRFRGEWERTRGPEHEAEDE